VNRAAAAFMEKPRDALRAGVLCLCFWAVAAPCAAQKNPSQTGEYRTERYVRAGLGVAAGTAGLGAGLDVTLEQRARVYRLRLLALDSGVGAMGPGGEPTSVAETAVMLGRGRRFGRNYGTVAAGVAWVSGMRDDASGPGIPLEAQLISGGPLRLGATLAANLNTITPFAAFVLSVQVGRVP
jgi:hypothetical protein